jgi:hypothetical protein
MTRGRFDGVDAEEIGWVMVMSARYSRARTREPPSLP